MAQIFYPNYNAKLSTTQKKFGNTSLYMDGDGDFVASSSTNSAEYDFGNQDFTIDWWEYRLSNVDARSSFSNNGTGNGMILNYNVNGTSGTASYFYCTDGTTVSNQVATNPVLNAWTHYAYVRYGSTITLYVNGQVLTTLNIGTKSIKPFTAFRIGRNYNNTNSAAMYGYMDEIRVSKGIARWTNTFTPHTEPYIKDSYDIVLLHCEGDNNSTIIKNECYDYRPVVNNGVINSTSQYKYGTGSLYFNNNGCYIENLQKYIAYAINQELFYYYTISFWWRPGNVTDKQVLFSHRSSGSTNNTMVLNYENNSGTKLLRLQVYNTTGNSVFSNFTASASAINADTWYFITIEKNDHYHSIWINNTRTYNSGGGNFNHYHSTEPFRIGYDIGDLASYPLLNSYIDNFRIQVGIRKLPTDTNSGYSGNHNIESQDIVTLRGDSANGSTGIKNDLVTSINLNSVSPIDNSYIFSQQDLIMNFDQNITAGSGNIVIYNNSDDTIFQTIAANSANVTINSSEVAISHNNFVVGNDYYILVDATAFDSFPGISSKTEWNFGLRTQYSKNLTGHLKSLNSLVKLKLDLKWNEFVWGDGTKWGVKLNTAQEYFKNLTANLKMNANKTVDATKNMANELVLSFNKTVNTTKTLFSSISIENLIIKPVNKIKNITTNLFLNNSLIKTFGAIFYKNLTTYLKISNNPYYSTSNTYTVVAEDILYDRKSSLDIGNNRILEMYVKDNGTFNIYYKIGTISDDNISYSQEYSLGVNGYFRIAKLDTDKIIINFLTNTRINIATISGDTINLNTDYIGQAWGQPLVISDSRFLIKNNTDIKYYSVSGTSINLLTSVTTSDPTTTFLSKISDNYLINYWSVFENPNTNTKARLYYFNDSGITLQNDYLNNQWTSIYTLDSTVGGDIMYPELTQSGFINNYSTDKCILISNSYYKKIQKNSGLAAYNLSISNTVNLTDGADEDLMTMYSENGLVYLFTKNNNSKIHKYIINPTNDSIISKLYIDTVYAYDLMVNVYNSLINIISYTELVGPSTYYLKSFYNKTSNSIKSTNKYINMGLNLFNIAIMNNTFKKYITNNIKLFNNKVSEINKNITINLNFNNLLDKVSTFAKNIITSLKLSNSKISSIAKFISTNINLLNLKTINLSKFISNNIKLINSKIIEVNKFINNNLTLSNTLFMGVGFLKFITANIKLSNSKINNITKLISTGVNLINSKIIEVNKFITANIKLSNTLNYFKNILKTLIANLKLSNSKIVDITKNIMDNLNLTNNKSVDIFKNITVNIKFSNLLDHLKTIYVFLTTNLKLNNLRNSDITKNINSVIKLTNSKLADIFKNINNIIKLVNSKIVNITKTLITNLILISYRNFIFNKDLISKLNLNNLKNTNITKLIINNFKLFNIKTILILKSLNNAITLTNNKIKDITKNIITNLTFSNLYLVFNNFNKFITNTLKLSNSRNSSITKFITTKITWTYNLVKRLWNENSKSYERIKSRFKNPKEPDSRLKTNEPKTRWNPFTIIKSRNKK
jgi:hypothetical protein